MGYYKDLREHIAALEASNKLVRVKKEINKDTELMSLVKWQFRGLPEEERKAFLFENVVDVKGRKYDIPVLVASHAASKDELKIGATIITPGDNLEDPAETKMCTWQKAVVSKIGDAVIEVEFFHVYKEESAGKDDRYLHNIFIIDEPKS